MEKGPNVAVVIPCYRVKAQVLTVIAGVGPEVSSIFCVDDGCPEQSGAYIEQNCRDARVTVIHLGSNHGVGGAMVAGYRAALAARADIVVKLDGDGQMDPRLLPVMIHPVAQGLADYTKGNRFYSLENLQGMPAVRLMGNAMLSFMAKFSTGYWNIVDPTNGYTAISAKVLALLPLDKLSPGWFFETDMMFRLNTIGAVIVDIPMRAVYGDEGSNLKVIRVMPVFLVKHIANYGKRILYNHFLRGFSIASVELVLGAVLTGFGVVFSILRWARSVQQGEFASAGTVMIGALCIIIGFQLLLSFLNEDMRTLPRTPLQGRLP